jgi:hypothetical protein
MKEVARRKNRASVRSLIEGINSDPVERLNFLLKPSEYLSKVGITLSPKASEELQVIFREYLRTYPEIALLPTGLTRTRPLSKRRPKGEEECRSGFEICFV